MLCSMAQAETYKVYSPFPVGSSPDILVRRLFETVQLKTQDTFIIINKPGGDGVIAFRSFIDDTSPRILATTTSLLANPSIDAYEHVKSLLFYYKLQTLLIATKDSKINSLNDVQGRLNVGSAIRNADMLFRNTIQDPNVQIITYSGDVDVINGLFRKELDLANVADASIIYKNNRDSFKVITNYEQAGISFGGGFVVPKSMGKDELMKLNSDLNIALQDESFRKWLWNTLEKHPIGGKPEVLDKVVNDLKVYQNKHK